ncbi:MAG: hypothetical protein USCGTAYLOR_02673 [Chromatiales bacterium USCg_Taylor]|nr:MAG: hypothetical protein USCGTAYLOR_02673 [Chromatiales bacterium USCg_Taylor]
MSPRIMKVAVPCAKHSPRFGQAASSHTVWRRRSLSNSFNRRTAGATGNRARIQGGLRARGGLAAGAILRRPVSDEVVSLSDID